MADMKAKLYRFLIIALVAGAALISNTVKVEASDDPNYKMLYCWPNDTTDGDSLYTVNLNLDRGKYKMWRVSFSNYGSVTDTVYGYHLNNPNVTKAERLRLEALGLVAPQQDTVQLGFKKLITGSTGVQNDTVYSVLYIPAGETWDVLVWYPWPDMLMFELRNVTQGAQVAVKPRCFEQSIKN